MCDMKNWQSLLFLCLSAGIHLTSTACGVCTWVCVKMACDVFPLCLALIKLEVSRLSPPAHLLFWRGDMIIHQEPKPSSSGPHCRFHRLFRMQIWAEITSCLRFSQESERRAQVVREMSVKLGQQMLQHLYKGNKFNVREHREKCCFHWAW